MSEKKKWGGGGELNKRQSRDTGNIGYTKFKVQSNLLKESPKLNINLQRQDKRDD